MNIGPERHSNDRTVVDVLLAVALGLILLRAISGVTVVRDALANLTGAIEVCAAVICLVSLVATLPHR